MSYGELLHIEPQEFRFPFELKKQISCSIQLTNKSDNFVAFKVKTTNPKKYWVRPNAGIVIPQGTCDVKVTMQAHKVAPADMQCRDKFLLQSVIARAGATTRDITPEMFNKESGNRVEECKLKVSYVSPPQPPSPVQEGSQEGSSPRASNISTVFVDKQDKSFKTISLAEERKLAKLLNSKLQQELELWRRESNKRRGGIPLGYVVIIGFLGILLGYFLKKT